MANISKLMSKDIGDLGKLLGINKSNLSKFMGGDIPSGLTAPWTETFTGVNGSDPNPTYWNPDPLLKIQSNQLHAAANDTNGRIVSKFSLAGDFDVFVSFDDLVTGTTQDNRIELMVSRPGLDLALIDARWRGAASIFYGFFRHDGNYFGQTQANRSNNYGGLRIIRSGTTITLRYKDGGGNWTTLTSTSNTIDDLNFIVTMLIYSMASEDVSGDFDNLTIQSGTIIFP